MTKVRAAEFISLLHCRTKLFKQTHFVIGCLLPGKAKVRMPCSFPYNSDFAGMMRPGHDQSTPFETSEKIPFIVAAVGRPPHFSSKLKSAALCREAATPVFQRSPFGLSAAGRAPHAFSPQIRGREGKDENEDDSKA
jgi:hypothetical protein